MTRSELLEEVVACHRLGCGLEVCVYPKPGFAKKYALLATRYGSNDTRFRVNGEGGNDAGRHRTFPGAQAI